MLESDRLFVNKVKAQSTAMIKQLENNNQQLDCCKQQIEAFLASQEIKGSAYTAAQRQMESYTFIINAIKAANEYDLDEHKRLMQLIGTEDLDGSVIITKVRSCRDRKKEAMQQLEVYQQKQIHASWIGSELYYELQVRYYEQLIEHYRKLYKLWEEKSKKFDEIAENTASLFQPVSTFRDSIIEAAKHIETRFDSATGKYNVNPTDKWKRDVYSAAAKCANAQAIRLRTAGFVNVIEQKNGKDCYGGNQTWFDDGTDEGKAISENGCGLIAIMNFSYYLQGMTDLYQSKYMKGARDFLEQHPKLYDNFVNKKEGMIPYQLSSDDDVQSYLDECAKQAGFSGATWECSEDISIEGIIEQLNRDIPVVFAVGVDSEKNIKLPLYSKSNQSDFNLSRHVEVAQHAVVITGVQTIRRLETGETEHMLQISTWGEELYVKFEEAVANKEKLLEDESDKKRYRLTGNYNYSKVK